MVKIDESKFGKRKYNVSRVVEGQWVFGGICRETRKFFYGLCPRLYFGHTPQYYEGVY